MIKTVMIAIPVLLIGGTEMQTLRLASALSSAGYFVTVCCYYEYDQGMVERFETAGAQMLLMKHERAQGLWHLTKGLLKVFRTLKPDIVHVQYLAPGLVPVIAARLAGIKILFAAVHQPGTIYGIREKLLLRVAAQLCSAFFCVSEAVEKSWFGDSRSFTPDIVHGLRRHCTIYNAVDLERIEAATTSKDRESLIRELNVAGKKIIGFIGRLRYEKGLHLLIDAMRSVIAAYPDAVLVVVGDGPDRASLELRAKSLELNSNIVWLGQIYSEEVYRLYSIMDIVAVPSLFEGFGLAAAEAMAAGIPVVGSNVEGLAEVIIHGLTGILVPQGNSGALASALIALLSDKAKAKDMGRMGRMRVRERFSLDIFRHNIISAYRAFDL